MTPIQPPSLVYGGKKYAWSWWETGFDGSLTVGVSASCP